MNELKLNHKINDIKPNLKQNIKQVRNSTEYFINKYINQQTKLILQIGSFTGSSTKYILDKFKDVIIISIDKWNYKLDTITRTKELSYMSNKEINIFDQFIVNIWNHKNRVIPIKMDTSKIFEYLKKFNLKPDIIYLDMGYGYEHTINDLYNIYKYYPSTLVLGNDIKIIDGLNKAVYEILNIYYDKYSLEILRNAYALIPKNTTISNYKGLIVNKINNIKISNKPLLIIAFFPYSKLGKRYAVNWYKKFNKIRNNIKVKNHICILFEQQQKYNIKNITDFANNSFNLNNFNILLHSSYYIPDYELIKYYSCEPINPIINFKERKANMILISKNDFAKINNIENIFNHTKTNDELIQNFIDNKILLNIPNNGKMQKIYFYELWQNNLIKTSYNYEIYKKLKWNKDYFYFIKN